MVGSSSTSLLYIREGWLRANEKWGKQMPVITTSVRNCHMRLGESGLGLRQEAEIQVEKNVVVLVVVEHRPSPTTHTNAVRLAVIRENPW